MQGERKPRTRGYEPGALGTISAGESRIKMSAESFRGTLHVGATVVGPWDMSGLSHNERYVTAGELGRGGMGRVDIVFDRVLGRYVAQKDVLEDDMGPMLVSEAQVCAQLEHPSIIPVYDLGTPEPGKPRYTMRVVQGRSLAEILYDDARPPLSQLLGVLRQVCLAVDYAHTRGVVHRDLKPDNILIGSFGEVYVLDWGIAYLTEDSDLHRSVDRAELVMAGTLAYMAPEQASPEGVAPPADIYALGVILYEILTGMHPFADTSGDLESVRLRRTVPPPSRALPDRKLPAAFDDLVARCFSRTPETRPTARAVANAIDAYLDTERELAERAREAHALVDDAAAAWKEHEDLSTRARWLETESEARLAELKPHDPVEEKMPAWELAAESRRLVSDAAHALARAEIAYASALGRIADQRDARRGLSRLHYQQFLAAETDANPERMARHLALARSYDDGDLALELADEGELIVQARPHDVDVAIARYETHGLLLRPGRPIALGRTPTRSIMLPSGSYLVTAGDLRYPLRIERAKTHHLSLRNPSPGEIPEGMVLIPGGPFLAPTGHRGKLERAWLPDFLIGRFPVTMGEYGAFLDSLDDHDRERRLPRVQLGDGPMIHRQNGQWTLTNSCVEPEARSYVPPGRELELPVWGITWYDACRFVQWRAGGGSLHRLPTALEWEKAMRGADGRAFPMGHHFDPCFAKTVRSRPISSQSEPVGAFTLDESPYGVRDLAGGVADWTATMVDAKPPPHLEEEGTPSGDERQAQYMGGHWGRLATAIGAQYVMGVKHRNAGVGFRLALGLDEETSDLHVEPMPER